MYIFELDWVFVAVKSVHLIAVFAQLCFSTVFAGNLHKFCGCAANRANEGKIAFHTYL